jgi:hypothetical protein
VTPGADRDAVTCWSSAVLPPSQEPEMAGHDPAEVEPSQVRTEVYWPLG